LYNIYDKIEILGNSETIIKMSMTQDKRTEKILAKQKAELALRPTNFTLRTILPVNTSAKEVYKSFSSQNYPFVLKVIRRILSLVDFSPDGKIHYELQSPPGQFLINERTLLDKLNVKGLMSHYGEDGIHGIITLGNINVKVLRKLELYLTNATQQIQTQNEIEGGGKSPFVSNQADTQAEKNRQSSFSNMPYCEVDKGWGYLKFGKYGKKKKIGKANTRRFMLLQTMLPLVGVSKTTESVFEAIRLPKDKNDTRLSDWNTGAYQF